MVCPQHSVPPTRRGNADTPTVLVSCGTHPRRAHASHTETVRAKSVLSDRQDVGNIGRRTRTSDRPEYRSSLVCPCTYGWYFEQQQPTTGTGQRKTILAIYRPTEIRSCFNLGLVQEAEGRCSPRQKAARLGEVVNSQLQLKDETARTSSSGGSSQSSSLIAKLRRCEPWRPLPSQGTSTRRRP